MDEEDAMTLIFYIAAAVAVICTVRVITHVNAVHALLYLIVSLLALALIFFLLGAPFAAALEVIIYAGAIMVLFVFVIMMFHLGSESIHHQRRWLRPGMWVGPTLLALILLGELVYILGAGTGAAAAHTEVGPRALGHALFGPYVLGVELISILLMAGLVGAYHLARPEAVRAPEGDQP
jgi:NADH-quinone oxidoreductase subunit J